MIDRKNYVEAGKANLGQKSLAVQMLAGNTIAVAYLHRQVQGACMKSEGGWTDSQRLETRKKDFPSTSGSQSQGCTPANYGAVRREFRMKQISGSPATTVPDLDRATRSGRIGYSADNAKHPRWVLAVVQTLGTGHTSPTQMANG
jgi:hypothetical protein